MMNKICVVSLFIFVFEIQTILCKTKVINFSPESLTIELGLFNNVSIKLNQIYSKEITINFTYGDENTINTDTHIIEPLPAVCFDPFENSSKSIELKTKNVGHLVLGLQSNDTEIPLNNILRLNVIHSNVLNILISIVGWIYFVAWSLSSYPQLILNWQTKDVSGLSLDFIGLNFLGNICYLTFNISLYWIQIVQHEYFQQHPRGQIPVLLNDVLFSIHATLLTFITVIQCFVYRQQGHNLSKIILAVLVISIAFLVISGIVCAAASNLLSNLQYAYFFSYVKLAITFKYIPQVYVNYKRKSTQGFSIYGVLCDFTGGICSLLQMFLQSYNYNDWTSIFGDFTKFGLGVLSILFDVLFMSQHYILYKSKRHSYDPIS